MSNKDNKFYLLGQRRYWPIFSTMFLGAFNDNVFKNALIILIAYQSYKLGPFNAESMVSLASGIFILPFFLFSAIAGQIADRFSKSSLVVAIKIWEVLAMSLAAVGFTLNSPALLMFTLFFMGTQSAFFGPLKYSILPELLEDNEILSGNAYFEMGTYIAILIGTIIGGIVITIGGNDRLPVIFTLLFFSLVGVFTGLATPKLKAVNPNLKVHRNPITPTIEILKLTFKKKNVLLSTLGISWFWFLGAIIITILPVMTKQFLHAHEYVFTFFLATFSIGIGIGSILCEKIGQEEIDLGLVIIGAYMMSIFLFALSFIHPIPLNGDVLTIKQLISSSEGIYIVVSMMLFALAAGFYSVPLYTYMQVYSQDGERSQIVAGNNILNALFMVVASILLIIFFQLKVSLPKIFLIFGVVNLILSYFTYKLIPEYFYRLTLSFLSRLLYKLEVNGTENIPRDGAVIIASNHITFIDWAFLCTVSKRPIRFIMHRDFQNLPGCGWFFRGAKIIPIAARHEDNQCYEDSFPLVAENLDKGLLVGIFPEGKITLNGEINQFRPNGLTRILETNPVPVVPIHIDGLWGTYFSKQPGAKSLKTLFDFKRKVTINIGKAIQPEEFSTPLLEKTVRDLK